MRRTRSALAAELTAGLALAVAFLAGPPAPHAQADEPAAKVAPGPPQSSGLLLNGSRVTIREWAGVAGVWLTCKGGLGGDGSVALIAQDNVGPYIALRSAKNGNRGLPDLAIAVDPVTGEPYFQLRDKSDPRKTRNIEINRLIDAVEKLDAATVKPASYERPRTERGYPNPAVSSLSAVTTCPVHGRPFLPPDDNYSGFGKTCPECRIAIDAERDGDPIIPAGD